jgi:hypothetical protein
LDTAKADWSEKMLKLYRAAGIEQRSHAFRDTLTTAVLGAGGNLETAAALLGHRDIKVTQKHYEHWDTERQRLLEEALERAWEKNGLSQARYRGVGQIGNEGRDLVGFGNLDELRLNDQLAGLDSRGDFESPPFTLEDFHRDEQFGIAPFKAPRRTGNQEHAGNPAEVTAGPVGTHVQPLGSLGNGQGWPDADRDRSRNRTCGRVAASHFFATSFKNGSTHRSVPGSSP